MATLRAGDILRMDARRYGEYVVKNRAFSEFCDGLKPAQRMILWACHFLKITNKSEYARSANIVGTATGRYHPHGDTVYEVMKRMTHNYVRNPYFKAEADFGDRFELGGAARYTEARLSDYGQSFLYPDYLDCVPYTLSYDGLDKIPIYLPSLLPNLLLNGSQGIGYGAAGFIPPFTLESVRPIIKAALLGKSYDPSKLEFNLMFDADATLTTPDYFKTGKGSLLLKPVRKISGDNTKYVLQHCYQLNSKMMKKIEKLAGEDPNIVRFYNMSKSSHKLNIEVSIKGTTEERKQCVARLDKWFTSRANMQAAWLEGPSGSDFYEDADEFSITFNRGGLREIIEGWASFRLEIEEDRLFRLEEKATKGRKFQRLLVKAALNIDILVKIIRSKISYNAMVEKIADALKITDDDAREILGLTLRRLSGLERHDAERKIVELSDEIDDLREKRANLESHTSALVDKHLAEVLTGRVPLY